MSSPDPDPTPKRGRGRPRTTGRYPPRQLGRISDEEWTELRDAAEREGESFTRWAVGHLLRIARSARKANQ